MTVELSSAIAIGGILFTAGTGWYLLQHTAKQGEKHGVRIGAVEKELSELRGEVKGYRRGVRRRTVGVPLAVDDDDSGA